MKYLSHLDLMRLLQRALRRAALPLDYSHGFNPHPRLSLAAPLPVGITAAAELGDIFFSGPVTPEQFVTQLNSLLPAGFRLTGAAEAALEDPPPAALVSAALYRAVWAGCAPAPAPETLREALQRLLSRPEIQVRRRGKGGRAVQSDIRPYIHRATLLPEKEDLSLHLLLQAGSNGGVSPFVLLDQLDGLPVIEGGAAVAWRLHREGLYTGNGENHLSILSCSRGKN
ncbi:MAG: TIGR03936 family radical SAM-associated protein [Bacillota bacterium]